MAAELTPQNFELLRCAVSIARNDQIKTVPRLRKRMRELFPGEEANISIVIQYWADSLGKDS